MPLYDYYCETCDKTEELLLSREDSDGKFYCGDCESVLLKQISAGAFILKGDGFYKPSSGD